MFSASATTGAANYTAGLNNFVAQNDGTYYISVTGDPGLKFNLVVTRGADFTTQPHTTLATAQDITATEQSGNPKQGGALGYLQNPSGATVGTTIEGIDFNGSNCGCLPPDTNAAVGNGFVAETVNVQFRVWDTAGNVLLDEPLSTLFGQRRPVAIPMSSTTPAPAAGTSPAIDGDDNSKEFLAISNDANPLDGFSNVYDVSMAASGDLPTSPSSATTPTPSSSRATTSATATRSSPTVDKAQAIAGTLVYYQSHRPCVQLPGPHPRPDARRQLRATRCGSWRPPVTRRTTAPRRTRFASPR